MKFFLKAASIVLIGFLFILSILLIVGYALEARLVNYTLDVVNKEFPGAVSAKSAKVSLIRNFPRAAVILREVRIANKTGSMVLLSLNEVRVNFNILKILRNQYSVSSLMLKKGNINFDTGPESSFFWSTFRPPQASPGAPLLLEFKEIILEDVRISYSDAATGWLFDVVATESALDGKILGNKYSFNLTLKGIANHIAQNDFNYLTNGTIALSLTADVDDKKYAVQGGSAKIEGSDLKFNIDFGTLSSMPIVFNLSGKGIITSMLLKFLAQKNVTLPAGVKTHGQLNINLSVLGKNGSSEPFAVNASFSSPSLQISMPGKSALFFEALSGGFTNGPPGRNGTTEAYLKVGALKMGASTIQGIFRMRNPQSPTLYFNGKADLQLADVAHWAPGLPVSSGALTGNIEMLGTLAPSDSLRFRNVHNLKANGDLLLNDISASFFDQRLQFSKVSGKVNVNGQSIQAQNIGGQCNGAAFRGNLSLPGLMKYLDGSGKFFAKAHVDLDFFDTDWLFSYKEPAGHNPPLQEPEGRIGEISASVMMKSLKYENFLGSDVSTSMSITPQRILFSNVSGKGCGGRFSGQVALEHTGLDSQRAIGEILTREISISSLFESFDNFGQKIVKSTNVAGLAESRINFVAPLQNWVIQPNLLNASVDVKVRSGRLGGLSQLDGLSRFIAMEELKSINFSAMENNIQIVNGIVTIPHMEVSSSALDFACSGIHNFSNEYSYRLRINLADILFMKASKSKPENSKFGEILSDGSGRTRLHLKIDGDSRGQRVSYDGKAAREEFRKNISVEREILKQALKEEFQTLFSRKATPGGDTLKGASPGSNKPKENSVKKHDESSKAKFQIDWE